MGRGPVLIIGKKEDCETENGTMKKNYRMN
jgi:hypothetical protein